MAKSRKSARSQQHKAKKVSSAGSSDPLKMPSKESKWQEFLNRYPVVKPKNENH